MGSPTAYLLFCKEKRSVVQEKNPGVSFTEQGKLLGSMWKSASEDEKKKYNDQAAAEKVVYNEAMEKFKLKHPNYLEEEKKKKKKLLKAKKNKGKAKKGGKKKKKKKDPNAPKGPVTAFLLFNKEVRASVKEENPEATFAEIGKKIGEKWKSLTDSEKKPFQDKADVAKAKYQRELAEYKKNKPATPTPSSSSESSDSSSSGSASDSDSSSSFSYTSTD